MMDITYPQKGSQFFSLSKEAQDKIYRYTFLMTRLTYSEKAGPFRYPRRERTIPEENSLALLRTCKKMRKDIGDTWLQYVLFNFGTCDKMVEMFDKWPYYIISRIRYLRVCNVFMTEWPRPRVPAHTIELNDNLPNLFFRFSGLQLDRLTVLAGDDSLGSYYAIHCLITSGNGWKELEYICRDSGIISQQQSESANNRLSTWQTMVAEGPIASQWRSALNLRDGEATKPSLTMYQKDAGSSIGQVWRNAVTDPEHVTDQLRIVVKRGAGVNYQQPRPPRVGQPAQITRNDRYVNRDEYDWSFWSDRFQSPYPGLYILHPIASPFGVQTGN